MNLQISMKLGIHSGEAKGRACRARHDHKFPKVGFSNVAKNSFYSAYKTQIDHVYFANVNELYSNLQLWALAKISRAE